MALPMPFVPPVTTAVLPDNDQLLCVDMKVLYYFKKALQWQAYLLATDPKTIICPGALL